LWHGFQFLLFTFVFKVENPRVYKEDGGRRLIAQVMVPASSPVESNWGMSRSLEPLPNPELATQGDEIGVKPPSVLQPRLVESSRLRPTLEEKRLPARSSSLAPVIKPSKVSLQNEESVPYGLSDELKARRVTHHPVLPSYPEWALVAAVELDLVVGLSVDESGVPHQVFIQEGCGDSQTDLSVLQYVEKMRFEPSLGVSRGTIEWAFRLDR
jgi:TonB family protein